MAREHARLLVTIWDDPDWTSLTAAEQQVYIAVLTSKDLSWCGVAPFLPQRYRCLSSDSSLAKTRKAFGTLSDGDPARAFLVIDHDTAEIAVRSFVRHDQLMKQPNVAVAMARALERVHSALIVEVIRGELGRLYYESPKLVGWERLAVADPELMAHVEQEAYGHPSEKGSRNPSANPSGKGW